MALFEFHVTVHEHVDTASIQAGITAIKTDVATLLALATATSEADKAAIVAAAANLDAAQTRVREAADANPVPT